jgi:DNA-binding CsgD family transcriptional regulator
MNTRTGTTTWNRQGNAAAKESHIRLTPAEAETLRLVEAGLTRLEVAEQMRVTLNTVNTRIAMAREKQKACG